ncbi:hypothetical protein [Methylorubrum extorquens]|uniref:hypothetical protein n=1 Tax=Methylorubrum extorquens TaxID=408 RepID=UPI00031A87A4|nr:hypothetical protein [Methylorubrum extorquens]MCP1545280.1 hypothetical protein [Methylorubrum extorquens]MCP1587373.1 hypothetical protein [Methylorubrum extorquens]
MADPYPLSSLIERPGYKITTTEPAYAIEVVVPFNEGTVAQARAAAETLIENLTI